MVKIVVTITVHFKCVGNKQKSHGHGPGHSYSHGSSLKPPHRGLHSSRDDRHRVEEPTAPLYLFEVTCSIFHSVGSKARALQVEQSQVRKTRGEATVTVTDTVTVTGLSPSEDAANIHSP